MRPPAQEKLTGSVCGSTIQDILQLIHGGWRPHIALQNLSVGIVSAVQFFNRIVVRAQSSPFQNKPAENSTRAGPKQHLRIYFRICLRGRIAIDRCHPFCWLSDARRSSGS